MPRFKICKDKCEKPIEQPKFQAIRGAIGDLSDQNSGDWLCVVKLLHQTLFGKRYGETKD